MKQETLEQVVYRAAFDAITAQFEESIDLDDLIRDVARSIIEDRAESIARNVISKS